MQRPRRFGEDRFLEFIDRAFDCVAIHRDGLLVHLNAAALAVLGYDRAEELIGRPILDLLHPDEHSIALERIGRLSPARPSNEPREERLLRKDGGIVVAEVSSTLIELDGKPAIAAVAHDVTERKRMQAQLLQADRLMSVGRLAAGVAHEINNPLTYVIGNLGFVAEELGAFDGELRALAQRASPVAEGDAFLRLGGRLDELKEALKEVRAGVERVRLIVRDLKTFSRVDEERRGPVDVRQVLESSINMAWNEIRHRARLVKDYRDVPPVEANDARLGQIFLNLLINAAQAMPEGDVARNEIRLTTGTDAGGRVVVEVRDTGMGIPPENLGRIFEPFFTTKPIGVGTGLGLAICHGIVTAIGGEIEVESEAGKGTVFRVHLPAQASSSPAAAKTPEASPGSAPRARVLVVDDEPALAAALRRTLAQEHDVVAVTSGRDALSLLEQGAGFDLVFCDLMMPDLTGMDLYEQLRRRRPGLEERMVFMTGGAFTPRALEFLASVPNLRIEKPMDPKNVRAIVRDHVRRRQG